MSPQRPAAIVVTARQGLQQVQVRAARAYARRAESAGCVQTEPAHRRGARTYCAK